MRKSIYTLIAAAFVYAVPAFSQNLNPQVQVTNDYKAEMGTSVKQSVPLEIPDSLTSFRTSVSYDVFSTPYKGSYEFVPYEISVTPQKPASDYSRFYLKAGAGYTLRPELQFVWTPIRQLSGNTLSVFNNFSGYAGNYGTLDPRQDYSGYDFGENFGVEGRYFARSFALSYGLNYNGIFTSDFAGNGIFNDFALNGRIRSDADAKLVYDFALEAGQSFDAQVSQTSVKAQGGFFPNRMLPFDLRVDFNIEADIYENGGFDNVFVAQISPMALFDWDPVRLSAGVTLSPAGDIQWLYPDVMITADLLDNTLQAYAFAKGGQFSRSYADLKKEDHWFGPSYTNVLRPTLERLNAALGARGSVFKYLQFDVRGGWASYSDAPMRSFAVSAPGAALMDCGIRYADYNTWYADADIHWKSPRFAMDLGVRYKYTNIVANSNYLDLPALTGSARAVYNWNSRIFAGISCNALTEQKSASLPVPGFVDLGLVGEYRFNSRFGAWANVGNLLNGDIILSPLHVQRGIYCTAGISLNMR